MTARPWTRHDRRRGLRGRRHGHGGLLRPLPDRVCRGSYNSGGARGAARPPRPRDCNSDSHPLLIGLAWEVTYLRPRWLSAGYHPRCSPRGSRGRRTSTAASAPGPGPGLARRRPLREVKRTLIFCVTRDTPVVISKRTRADNSIHPTHLDRIRPRGWAHAQALCLRIPIGDCRG